MWQALRSELLEVLSLSKSLKKRKASHIISFSLDPGARKFWNLLFTLSKTPMKLEIPQLLQDALSIMPENVIYKEAKDLEQIYEAQTLSLGVETKEWDYQDYVIQALLRSI